MLSVATLNVMAPYRTTDECSPNYATPAGPNFLKNDEIKKMALGTIFILLKFERETGKYLLISWPVR
jgi:hypothetical protein